MSETGPQDQPDEAMLDLLIKQVTEGLSPAEQRALDVLDSAVASGYARSFERAAAAVVLASTRIAEPPPEALRARIEEQARAFFASAASGAPAGTGATEPPAPVTPVPVVPVPTVPVTPVTSAPLVAPVPSALPPPPAAERRAARRGAAAGWWAAAACLVLAVLGWLRSPPINAPAAPPTQRAELLARPDSLKVSLGATQDPAAAGVTGDVVWNPATQRGFLHLVGLKPNDPRVHQYQLWIFDGERDQRYPVDGGVFDVPANASEVLVPIRAAVPVHAAKAFAVTVEEPGGAVVSARDHVVALGQAT